jgi:hypothetical protein
MAQLYQESRDFGIEMTESGIEMIRLAKTTNDPISLRLLLHNLALDKTEHMFYYISMGSEFVLRR